MDAKLQRRIQRYGWDLASADYEPLWRTHLAPAHQALLDFAALRPGERVLDVACGTGLITFAAARAVAPGGWALGVDISGEMLAGAAARVRARRGADVEFMRMDAEALDLPDETFDVALCALGLMYLPDPGRALAEMRRVLRPGGRLVAAIWGRRADCGWAAAFPIVDAEVASEVCPLFFALGEGEALADLCAAAGFAVTGTTRLATTLVHASGQEACDAAFVGGPMALAWSRFDAETRIRACQLYLDAVAAWRRLDGGYDIPGEFVVVSARATEIAPPA